MTRERFRKAEENAKAVVDILERIDGAGLVEYVQFVSTTVDGVSIHAVVGAPSDPFVKEFGPDSFRDQWMSDENRATCYSHQDVEVIYYDR